MLCIIKVSNHNKIQLIEKHCRLKDGRIQNSISLSQISILKCYSCNSNSNNVILIVAKIGTFIGIGQRAGMNNYNEWDLKVTHCETNIFLSAKKYGLVITH